MPAWAIVALVAGWLVLFPALWLGVVWLTAQFGWAGLARRYPGDEAPPPDGRTFPGLNVYPGVLGRDYGNVTVAPDGLHLHPQWPFRAGRAPIAVPWSEVVALKPGVLVGFKLEFAGGGSLGISRFLGGAADVRQAIEAALAEAEPGP